MNPGEKIILKIVVETRTITVGGLDITEDVEVGSVVRAVPGPVVPGAEYIVLNVPEGSFKWNAPLADYSTAVDDEPANEPRWVLV